jgi:hypothetical protein
MSATKLAVRASRAIAPAAALAIASAMQLGPTLQTLLVEHSKRTAVTTVLQLQDSERVLLIRVHQAPGMVVR